jgi:hypothetical protein
MTETGSASPCDARMGVVDTAGGSGSCACARLIGRAFLASRTAIAHGCLALLLVLGLALPMGAQARARNADRVPAELWRTYPLQPVRGAARIRTGVEPDRFEASGRSSVDSRFVEEDGRSAGQSAPVGDASPDTVVLTLLVLAAIAVLAIVIVLITLRTEAGAFLSALARLRTAGIAPLRSLSTVPRPSSNRRPVRPARSRQRPRFPSTTVDRERLPSHLSHGGSVAVGLQGVLLRLAAAIADWIRWSVRPLIPNQVALQALMGIAIGIVIGIGVALVLDG